MYQDRVVLCASSAYEKKYYINEDFQALPEQIKNELKIMCVLFTEDVGAFFPWNLIRTEPYCSGLMLRKTISF